MAGKDGQQDLSSKRELLSAGHRYSFVQAYRLLRLLVPGDPFHGSVGQGKDV